MSLTVREKADAVATYRFVSVHLMETLARWVPTTPELEAKALFGRHIWEFAQHADVLGRRTTDLRAAPHQNRPPVTPYLDALEALRAVSPSADRIAAFYDAAVPDLDRRYGKYLADADPLLDEPTIRILERARADFARMQRDRTALLQERGDLAADPSVASLHRRSLDAVDELVNFRPATDDVAAVR